MNIHGASGVNTDTVCKQCSRACDSGNFVPRSPCTLAAHADA
jgi:hypothetical protein